MKSHFIPEKKNLPKPDPWEKRGLVPRESAYLLYPKRPDAVMIRKRLARQ